MPGKSFRVTLGTPTEGVTEAIAAIRVEESADGQSAWSEIQTTPVAALIDEGAGRLRLDAPAADQTAYHRLVPITASGVERQASTIHPPLPATPGTFLLYVYTADLGLGVKQGVHILIKPVKTVAKAGQYTLVSPLQLVTDAEGFASAILPSDMGRIIVSVANADATIQTDGLAGSAINLKDRLV